MTAAILAATEHLVLRRMTNDDARRTGGVPKRPGAGPLTVMGDARPPREHIDAAHDALKTSRTVGTVWARDPNLKIKDQAARC